MSQTNKKDLLMNLDLYLNRIGFKGPATVSLSCLFGLQRSHMLNVPFENLDVYMGRPLKLDPADLFEKIVTHRRGGYCFELNTLYGAALREIGFDVTPILARVWLRNPPQTPSLTHMLHKVSIDGQIYISDVGFGGLTTRIPLNISNPVPVDDQVGLIRLHPCEFGQMVQRQTPDGWENQFSFTGEPAVLSDVLQGNHFTETHPSSHFRHNRFIGLFTEQGRNGLSDLNFTSRAGDELTEKTLANADEWIAFIEQEFGLILDLTKQEKDKLLDF